ncbi:MAG: pyridoxamine 5'-phosphate oxidase family protein [Actinomycetota bacterium]|nr:pyridoxamine 5'-phosphate oxidase family protein [Actinomycetota bacterium]
MPRHAESITEILDERECLRLVAQNAVGRIAFVGQFDLTVLPVNYRLVDGAILFRTGQDSATVEDLTTGMRNAEYRVAFEVDHLDEASREGWSVLIQGPAHHVDPETEQAAALAAGIHPWAGGAKDHFIRIKAVRITGRRVRQAP